jgi:hypothetical protein
MSRILRAAGPGTVIQLSLAVFLAVWFVGAIMPAPAPAANLLIDIDGLMILDNGAGDLDPNIDKIDFAQISANAGYLVQGTLQLSPAWPPGPSVGGMTPPAIGALTLTSFTAQAISTSTLGATLAIRIRGDVPGSFGTGTAEDWISAEIGSASNTPVAAGTDVLQIWNCAVYDNANYVPIQPLSSGLIPQGNPAHPGPGTTPYVLSGHGPTPTPAFSNPTIDGLMVLSLGQFDDQFILPSSAEIGFNQIPEPGTAGIAGAALALCALARGRAQRAACAECGFTEARWLSSVREGPCRPGFRSWRGRRWPGHWAFVRRRFP